MIHIPNLAPRGRALARSAGRVGLILLWCAVSHANEPPSGGTPAPSTDPSAVATPGPEAAAPVEARPSAPEPPISCEAATDAAIEADAKLAAQRQRRAEPMQLLPIQQHSVAQWKLAAARCEGRAADRAQRNLRQSEAQLAQLEPLTAVSERCTRSRRDARAFMEAAQAAGSKGRWTEAVDLFHKADDAWDVAGERCTGPLQQEARTIQAQLVDEIHNAQHCGPLFDRAARFWQRLREQGPQLSRPERQRQLDVAETLWRECSTSCKGPALELATQRARTADRERGRPWKPTPPTGEILAWLDATDEDRPAAVAQAGLAQAPRTVESPGPTAAASRVSAPSAQPTPASPPRQGLQAAVPAQPSQSGDSPAQTPAASPSAATTSPVAGASLGAPAPARASAGGAIQDAAVRAVDAVRRAGEASAQSAALVQAAAAAAVIDITLGSGAQLKGRFVKSQTGDSYSGDGLVRWPRGDEFEGEILTGAPHGKGTMKWADGRRYAGQWSQGDPQGDGEMRYPSGDVYIGSVAKGVPHGRGQYRWINGQHYEGQWSNGQPHGDGQMRFVNGNRFQGEFVQGEPQGRGELQFASGDVYAGDVRQGRPHGQGRYRWTDGSVYSGAWVDGLKEGRGSMRWPNGDEWEGLFKGDQQTDQGTITRASPPPAAQPSATPPQGPQ